MNEATPMPGTVVDKNGDPCPRAISSSYPLFARCEHDQRSITVADGSATWVHSGDRSAVCRP